jgi:RNA polymerase-binding transcription factor DksA
MMKTKKKVKIKSSASRKRIAGKTKRKKNVAARTQRSITKIKSRRAVSSNSIAKSGKKVKSSSVRRGKTKFKVEEKRRFKERLLAIRINIKNQINSLATNNLKRSQYESEVEFRSQEQGTDNYNRDFALTRVSLVQNILFEINEALSRLKLGTFGICEDCGATIEKARLVTLPYSRLCVHCQSQAEKNGQKIHPFAESDIFPLPDTSDFSLGTDDE